MNGFTGQDRQDRTEFGLGMADAAGAATAKGKKLSRPMRLLLGVVGLVMMADGLHDINQGLRARAGAGANDRAVMAQAPQETGRGAEAREALRPNGAVEQPVADESGGGYDGFKTITVESDEFTMRLDVPSAWGQNEAHGWEVGDIVVGDMVVAAPDLEGFLNGYYVPGVIFAASHDLAEEYDGPGALLDDLGESIGTGACTYGGRSEYSDGYYTGVLDVWSGCGENGAEILVIGAAPGSGDYVVYVLIQAVSEADGAAAEAIIESFIADSHSGDHGEARELGPRT